MTDHHTSTVEAAAAYDQAHAGESTWPKHLGEQPAWWGPYDQVPSGDEL